MNTNYNKSVSTILVFLVLIIGGKRLDAQHIPVWPVAQNEDADHWDRVNCTFGERHGNQNPHFHGGIDIDVDNNQWC